MKKKWKILFLLLSCFFLMSCDLFVSFFQNPQSFGTLHSDSDFVWRDVAVARYDGDVIQDAGYETNDGYWYLNLASTTVESNVTVSFHAHSGQLQEAGRYRVVFEYFASGIDNIQVRFIGSISSDSADETIFGAGPILDLTLNEQKEAVFSQTVTNDFYGIRVQISATETFSNGGLQIYSFKVQKSRYH